MAEKSASGLPLECVGVGDDVPQAHIARFNKMNEKSGRRGGGGDFPVAGGGRGGGCRIVLSMIFVALV